MGSSSIIVVRRAKIGSRGIDVDSDLIDVDDAPIDVDDAVSIQRGDAQQRKPVE
jgi:hypothetical protein